MRLSYYRNLRLRFIDLWLYCNAFKCLVLHCDMCLLIVSHFINGVGAENVKSQFIKMTLILCDHPENPKLHRSLWPPKIAPVPVTTLKIKIAPVLVATQNCGPCDLKFLHNRMFHAYAWIFCLNLLMRPTVLKVLKR